MTPYTYCVERRPIEGRMYWAVGYHDDKGGWHLCGFGTDRSAQERQAWQWNHHVAQMQLPENRPRRTRAPRTAGAGSAALDW